MKPQVSGCVLLNSDSLEKQGQIMNNYSLFALVYKSNLLWEIRCKHCKAQPFVNKLDYTKKWKVIIYV